MTASHASIRARVEAWRELGADRLAPLRFHRIEALGRRAQACCGEARRVLEERLTALVEDYADIVDAAAPAREAPATTQVPGPLAQLLDALARTPAVADTPEVVALQDDAIVPAPHLQEMDALRDLRRIWSDVRNRSQLRQSLQQTAEDAGPLNSSRLVHRMLSFMGRQSPGYLEHFLSYADTLSWLEQMQAGGMSAAESATQAGGKRTRRAARARR